MQCLLISEHPKKKEVRFQFTRGEQTTFLLSMILAIIFVLVVTQYFLVYLISVISPKTTSRTTSVIMIGTMFIILIIFFFSFYYRIKDIFTPVTLEFDTEQNRIRVHSPFKDDQIEFTYSDSTLLIHDYGETKELVFQDPRLYNPESELKNGMYRIPRSTFLSLADKLRVFQFIQENTPIQIIEFEDMNLVVTELQEQEQGVELTPEQINTLLRDSSLGKIFSLEDKKSKRKEKGEEVEE